MKEKRKKRVSRSTSPGASHKRPRLDVMDETAKPAMLRAKSVFRGDQDPYFPGNNGAKSSQPTSSDWQFRLKIVCSDLQDDEIFKETVQGLVKTCFPEGVLDELGIGVVEQHMREANASEAKISRMQQVFRAEMVHRTAWMLAKYLGGPDKLEAGIASVVAATNRLHGSKIDHGVLDDIISAFQQLRDEIISDDSRHIASGGGLSIPTSKINLARTDRTSSFDVITGKEDMEKGSLAVNDRRNSGDGRPKQKKNKNKVAKSWCWNIDPDVLNTNDIPDHFSTAINLFAFHALPVVKADLGAEVRKAVIRRTMDNVWTDMSEDLRKKWKECFRKLCKGDLSMLKRVRASGHPNERHATVPPRSGSEIPEECESSEHEQVPSDEGATSHLCSTSNASKKANTSHSNHSRMQSQGPVNFKREGVIGADGLSKVTPRIAETDNSMVHTISAFRHLSTEETREDSQAVSNKEHNLCFLDAPILDLLWERAHRFPQDWRAGLDALMDNLTRRVRAQSFGFPSLQGTMRHLSKSDLRNALVSILCHRKVHPDKKKDQAEKQLIIWVVAHISAFQELDAEPFIFVYMMQYLTPVLDLLCGPQADTSRSNNARVRECISQQLHVRGINKDFRCGPKHATVHALLCDATSEIDEVWRRVLLERALRCVAISRRGDFPELKTSDLVRSWESSTGQKW